MLWLKSGLKGVLSTYIHTYVYTCNVISTCVQYVCVHANICFVLVCIHMCPGLSSYSTGLSIAVVLTQFVMISLCTYVCTNRLPKWVLMILYNTWNTQNVLLCVPKILHTYLCLSTCMCNVCVYVYVCSFLYSCNYVCICICTYLLYKMYTHVRTYILYIRNCM